MDLRGMRVFGSAGIKRLIANDSKALEDYILRGFSLHQFAITLPSAFSLGVIPPIPAYPPLCE
jgi:hypothetical protein